MEDEIAWPVMQAFRVKKHSQMLGGYLYLYVDRRGVDDPQDLRELVVLTEDEDGGLVAIYRDIEWRGQWNHQGHGGPGLILHDGLDLKTGR